MAIEERIQLQLSPLICSTILVEIYLKIFVITYNLSDLSIDLNQVLLEKGVSLGFDSLK